MVTAEPDGHLLDHDAQLTTLVLTLQACSKTLDVGERKTTRKGDVAMAATRKLPPTEVLEVLRLDQRRTLAEIADMYGVTREAVRQQLRKAGIAIRPWTRFADEVPWKIAEEHRTAHPLNMLRALARIQRGMEISEPRRQEAMRWAQSLRRQGLVVGYGWHRTPDGVLRNGFFYTRAREKDRGYILEPDKVA